MRSGWLLILILALLSCSGEEVKEKVPEVKKEEPQELVHINGNEYTEYYEGSEGKVRFNGYQDDQNRRHGRWTHYSINGKELSMTMYEHGLKNGHSVVHYPNGALYYYGEYHMDTMVGIWKTYDQQGKLISEKDYGYPQH